MIKFSLVSGIALFFVYAGAGLFAQTSEEYICPKGMSVYSGYCLGPTRENRMNYPAALKTCEAENKLLASPYILKEWSMRTRQRVGYGFWARDKGIAYEFSSAGNLIQERKSEFMQKNWQRLVKCMERAKVRVHSGGNDPNPAPYGSKKGSDWGCWCLGELIRSLFGGDDSD